MDLIGFSNEELIYQDSNTGHLETILGGVGRNIAENLKHLDFDVEFLTVLADDEFSKMIINSCNNLGISIAHSLIKENSKTSIFMAIMDRSNDMALGLTAMDIYNEIPDAFILDNLDVIAQSDYCVIETNLPTSTLELVTEKLPNVRFALEAVSAKKALKAKTILDKLYILKCNAMEAELLSGIKVNYEIEYEKVVAHFLELGVKKVFITLGIDGVAYGDENEIFIDKNKIISPVNTTGAGDAFMAGILYGETKGMELYDMVQFASACAQITIIHQDAVNPDICVQKVLETLQHD